MAANRPVTAVAGLLAVPVLTGLLTFALARAAEDPVLPAAAPDGPLTVVGSVTLEPATPAAGQPVTARVRVAGDRSVRLRTLVVKVRDDRGAFHDFPARPDFPLTPSAADFVVTTAFPAPGRYFAYLAYDTGDGPLSLPPWAPFTVR
ncbi:MULTISPECIES: hypothetical protein [unclassified Amycolatopsis]|uniref:hypothetical protein n=1 Tax=unclassified Amycolatopsis TaxID=2618356 RepID=UPI002E0F30B7|nr:MULTISPECIES: hypothetical protein [unclassified Amycolatopsis]WSJ74041.1 hypothetical protein OG439_31860 [Amycolatopsis sp. NBC_01307]WSK82317.1 hypothetical protein OG570_17860 [Amycolatopsis sp. NBC_01286]